MEKSVVCQNIDEHGNPCNKILTFESKFCSNCGSRVDNKLFEKNCNTEPLISSTNIKPLCINDPTNPKEHVMDKSESDCITFKNNDVSIETVSKNLHLIDDQNKDINYSKIESEDSINENNIINENSTDNNNKDIDQIDINPFEDKQLKCFNKTIGKNNDKNKSEIADPKYCKITYTEINHYTETNIENNNFDQQENSHLHNKNINFPIEATLSTQISENEPLIDYNIISKEEASEGSTNHITKKVINNYNADNIIINNDKIESSQLNSSKYEKCSNNEKKIEVTNKNDKPHNSNQIADNHFEKDSGSDDFRNKDKPSKNSDIKKDCDPGTNVDNLNEPSQLMTSNSPSKKKKVPTATLR